jgi:hypothetical protein
MQGSWVVADCVADVPSLNAQLSGSWRGGCDRPGHRYLCAGRHSRDFAIAKAGRSQGQVDVQVRRYQAGLG